MRGCGEVERDLGLGKGGERERGNGKGEVKKVDGWLGDVGDEVGKRVKGVVER